MLRLYTFDTRSTRVGTILSKPLGGKPSLRIVTQRTTMLHSVSSWLSEAVESRLRSSILSLAEVSKASSE